MKIFLCILACVSIAMACSCYPQSANDAYCEADSVSHVKVTSIQKPDSDNTWWSNVYYEVEHLHIYKKPTSLITLPSSLRTPSSEEICGLHLNVGEEYLLSGYFRGDKYLRVYLCGHVNDNNRARILKWQDVSEQLRANLTSFQC